MSGEDTPPKRPKSANLRPPWKPGQSGNPAGRPKGARSKLSEDFFAVLAADFAKHGKATVEAMRNDRPADYVKAIASLQTKEVSGEDGSPIQLGEVIFRGLNG